MKAEITITQLYHNPSVMNFFFRSQAEKTFQELCDRVNVRELFDAIEEYTDSVDELEELFYNESTAAILEELGLSSDEDNDYEEDYMTGRIG